MQAAAAKDAPSGAVVFVFATVFLDMLAFGMAAPILPKLVLAFTGDVARSAVVVGLFGTVFALMQFLCSPLLGMLSDRFGRRPVIVLSNAGLGLDFVLLALAPSLGWLFAGRVIAGMTSATAATANAYVADVAAPEKRAAGFGVLGAAFGLGFIVGPAIGGLLGSVSPRLPFWTAAVLTLTNAAYGLCVLPESLPQSARRPLAWTRGHPLGALDMLRSSPALRGLSGVIFLTLLAGSVLPSIYVLYVAHRFGWDDRGVGLSLTAVGIAFAVVQAALVKRAVQAFGERGAMVLGLSCGAAGMLLFGSAANGLAFALCIPLAVLWSLAPAAAQGIMTRRVSPSEQGRLQGALGTLASVTALFGPALFGITYARTVVTGSSPVAGIAWFLSALLLIGATILTLRLRDA